MEVTQTAIRDVFIFTPRVFSDNRGCFFESFNQKKFSEAVGRQIDFVQDNQSVSAKGVLRGLHYQVVRPQAKLVRVSRGSALDIAVDIRQSSPTFGKWVSAVLSAENNRQLWIPEGFAHGFVALEDNTQFLYKVTDYWYPEHERTIRYDDPQLAIDWGCKENLILSGKDLQGCTFSSAELFA